MNAMPFSEIGSADRARIGGEAAPPQAVAQNDDVPAGDRVVFGREVAPEGRLDAEQPEEVRRHTHACDAFGLAVGDERRRPRS